MGSVRENTVELDFTALRRELPPLCVIHIWIVNELKLEEDDIDTVQFDSEKANIYIKLINKERFEKKIDSLLGTKVFIDNKKRSWNIPVRELAETTYVRVMNLPVEIDMKIVEEELKPYGEILSSSYERFGRGYALKVRSGVRAFKMILIKPVPSFLKIIVDKEGEEDQWTPYTAQIVYAGQTKTCRVCKDNTHFARNCPRRSNAEDKIKRYWNRGVQGQTEGQQRTLNENEFPALTKQARPDDKKEKQQQQTVNKDIEMIESDVSQQSTFLIEDSQTQTQLPNVTQLSLPPPATKATIITEQDRKRMRRDDDEEKTSDKNGNNFESLTKAILEKNKKKEAKEETNRGGGSGRSSRSSSRSRASSTNSLDNEGTTKK